MQANPSYLNDVMAAEMMGLAPITLRKWRQQGCGPSFIKIGRAVRYKLDDLVAWMDSHRVGGESK